MISHNNLNYSSTNKYAISFPGILKLLTILLFLTSSTIFLIFPLCSGKPYWYSKLYPIVAATCGVIVTFSYIFFAIGIFKKEFYIWDLILNTINFIIMLVISIITTTACEKSTNFGTGLPGPMGILGSILLAISSAVWYVQKRISKEINVDSTNNNEIQYRKSTVA